MSFNSRTCHSLQIDPDISCSSEAHVTVQPNLTPTFLITPFLTLLPTVQVACMPAHDVCTQVVAGGTMQIAVFEAASSAASAAARALHALIRARLVSTIELQS